VNIPRFTADLDATDRHSGTVVPVAHEEELTGSGGDGPPKECASMHSAGYAAEASLSTTRRFYRGVFCRPVAGPGPTVVAQLSPCDPCDICGDEGSGGGGQRLPSACPHDKPQCCGRVVNGRCDGQCISANAHCQ
jgi:hypothetical protein